jgi:cupin superfamily acireductone dioxygenase involved in methionine salvage
MAQQTAVEWFWIHLPENISKEYFDLFEQAKAMEIESLEDCWIAAEQSEDSQTFFNYYNETYNK